METVGTLRDDVDERWMAYARRRIESLTMPRWALGALCDLMVDLVRIQRTETPSVDPSAVIVFAADHGIAARGVSAFPREVTGQMIRNFLDGGAAISVLAREQGSPLYVIDMGTCGPIPQDPGPGYVPVRLQSGTGDFLDGPAMSRAIAERAIAAGREWRERSGSETTPRMLLAGEMGIGATTSAAALAALLLEQDPDGLIGRGTGVDQGRFETKRMVVRQAFESHRAQRDDPIGLLAAVGGLEIAGLVGLLLDAAERRTPVLLDGFIVGVAALVAVRIDPRVRGVLIAGHVSAEPGHRPVLAELGLAPILDLGLRLGEASGAALAWPIVRSAARLFNEMATFTEADVASEETPTR